MFQVNPCSTVQPEICLSPTPAQSQRWGSWPFCIVLGVREWVSDERSATLTEAGNGNCSAGPTWSGQSLISLDSNLGSTLGQH